MAVAHSDVPEGRSHPPGPPGLPLIGNLELARGDARLIFQRAFRDYGDLVRFHFAGLDLYLVSRPAWIQHILQENNANYTKGRALAKARPLLGNDLLTSEGDFWRRQRRLAQPAFHRQRIVGFFDVMADATAAMLDRWEPLAAAGRPFDVAAEMMRLTLTIVARTLFHTALSPEELARVEEAMPAILRETNRRIASPFDLRERLPTPARAAFERHLAELDGIVYRIIAERRHSGEDHEDLLGLLMSAQDEETGLGMSDAQLRDEVMTLFLAGHETTANLLSWTWHLLSLHPGVRARLIAEVDGRLAGLAPDPGVVASLVYARQVIDESLRLFPPAWAFSRAAIAPDRLGDHAIPARANVVISPYIVHRHPDYWENPEGFQPDRFRPGQATERPRFAYLPFGGGPRLCIGQQFALTEALIILAMTLQRFTLDREPGYPATKEVAVTMRPASGVWVRARARR